MSPITIAIDYDGTFTADPSLWSKFVASARALGHRIYMVTARRYTQENNDQINADLDHYDCQMPIVFTAHSSKMHVCEKRGIKIDIWIDDDPKTLVHGH